MTSCLTLRRCGPWLRGDLPVLQPMAEVKYLCSRWMEEVWPVAEVMYLCSRWVEEVWPMTEVMYLCNR